MASVTIKDFGLQTGTDRTIYVTWNWSKENTANYLVRWYYYTGDDNIWFFANESTVEVKQSTYSAPSNATAVRVVVKPVSKTYRKNDTDVVYWTADWSTEKIYYFDNNPPLTPPVPKVSIENYTLTATLDNLDVHAKTIEFYVIKNNSKTFSRGYSEIITHHASYACTVEAGNEYKVACRSISADGRVSKWSDYSENVNTAPAASSGITDLRATSETSVYIEWAAANAAKSYDIEYATKLQYFDSSDQTQTITDIKTTHYEKTGLESGEEYFFRVRSVNDKGTSSWSETKSIIVGKVPVAPTTWSSSTTVVAGELLTLYWVHNSEDASYQSSAEIELYINGVKEVRTIIDDTTDKKDIASYALSTTGYVEGAKIQWRVRTAGITKEYGEWSIQRSIDIYNHPTLELQVTDLNDASVEILTHFPFYIYAVAGPNTQTPIGYHVSITANETYETTDSVGVTQIINKGQSIYSKHFYTSEPLMVEMSANNIDLENNGKYTISCSVSMNSGLTAEATREFTVAWTDTIYEPDAAIGIDEDTFTASIRPYCKDENRVLVEDVLLSVYRREFDGGFTLLASDIVNTSNTHITDPHPALDYARYRIIAISKTTGAVSYYDVPGYPVGGKAVIIQWDEEWSSFDVSNEDKLEQPVWSGSMLKLPYNIDISDNHTPDVELVQYIGRERPIAYYGTQLGHTSVWRVEIPQRDKDTLYALRRLAKWMGNVYVREPSGSGYWANISVMFSQEHCKVVIPVTLNVTRVEGGA